MSENGKIPPQATDFEEAVLGAIMLEKEALIDTIGELQPEYFYKDSHQIIFKAIQKLFNNSSPVDILTVTKQLHDNGELEMAGGAFFITQLTSRVASSDSIQHHSLIIVQKFIQRELIRISTETIKNFYDDTTDIFTSLSELKTSLDGIDDLIAKKRRAKDFSAIIDEAVKEVGERKEKAKLGKVMGINTGLGDLNNFTSGWQPGDIIILAARPGMGKTALGLFFAKKAARYGSNSCFFSLEMTSVRLVDRLILAESGVDSNGYRNGKLSESDMSDINKAATRLRALPMYIDDNPGANVTYIHSVCRMKQRRNNCDLVVIDYLQLIEQAGRNQNREAEVASISRKLKKMALELKVPVIVLCQLSREVEKRGGDRKPKLSDLRESGAIEQDADIVIFPWRPAYYGMNDESGASLEGMGELVICKNRNGAPGEVRFKHNPAMNDFFDYAAENYPIPPNISFNDKDAF